MFVRRSGSWRWCGGISSTPAGALRLPENPPVRRVVRSSATKMIAFRGHAW
jgi:hypothetical protein